MAMTHIWSINDSDQPSTNVLYLKKKKIWGGDILKYHLLIQHDAQKVQEGSRWNYVRESDETYSRPSQNGAWRISHGQEWAVPGRSWSQSDTQGMIMPKTDDVVGAPLHRWRAILSIHPNVPGPSMHWTNGCFQCFLKSPWHKRSPSALSIK